MNAGGWTVYVDDNFHYRDEEERYVLGTFDTYEAAVEACRKIVDAYFHENSAATAEKLFDSYTSFGEDPWTKGPPPPGSVKFSGWDYARQRCNELLPGDEGRDPSSRP